MDCSPPGSSVHGILQARILEWVAIPFSRGISQPRDQTRVSRTAGRFFANRATREALLHLYINVQLHIIIYNITYLVGQVVKNLPMMQKTRVWPLCWEDPLEKEMTTRSRILAWRIPWMEEPGGLQSTGSQAYLRHALITPPHQQKDLLDHEEQHSPSTSKPPLKDSILSYSCEGSWWPTTSHLQIWAVWISYITEQSSVSKANVTELWPLRAD